MAAQPNEVKELAVHIFNKPDVIERFQAILGTSARSYIQSALLCITDNPKLLDCTSQSLVKSALRSATLGLSLDPVMRQAFMIPRWDKNVGAKVANFQPHYNGLYNLATRTGRYRVISVNPIYEGERVLENVQTGLHVYCPEDSGTLLMPDKGRTGLDNGYRDVTSGKSTARVIGYLGYFKQIDGLEKSVWMTVEEIHKHAQVWAAENYNSEYGAWKDNKKRPTMEMKTVFIALTKFMDLSGERNAILREAIAADAEDDETITVEPTIVQQSKPATEPRAEKPTDPVSPRSQWAIKYAAEEWNMDLPEASRQLADANWPETMTRAEFVKRVTGAE